MTKTHSIWGIGDVKSNPIRSKILGVDVVMFNPDFEDESFVIAVPLDELH